MGKEKYRKDIEALFAKSPVVHASSIAAIIKQKRDVKYYVERCIHYLLASGKIKQLAKGWYTTRDDPSLAVFCFQPAYLGLQDALSFHNIGEQETIPVIVTIKKVRPGIRTILGRNVLIRRIQKKYVFGIVYASLDTVGLPYSDIEKTLLDMIYFKEYLGKDILKVLKKRVDRKKLLLYSKEYPEGVRKRILGYLKK